MYYKLIDERYIDDVMELFCDSFFNDSYYQKMFQDVRTRKDKMKQDFSDAIIYCLTNGVCLGIFDESKLIAFYISFDYQKVRNDKKLYNMIFAPDDVDDNYEEKVILHNKLKSLEGDTLYCLSIAIDEKYRSKGLASLIIDEIIEMYPDKNMVSDGSNASSLKLYIKRGYSIEAISDNYFLIVRKANTVIPLFNSNEIIRIAMNDDSFFTKNEIEYKYIKDLYIKDVVFSSNMCFEKKDGAISLSKIYEISYVDYLKLQKQLKANNLIVTAKVDYILFV